MTDMVNHPPHYTSHPSGVEAITITEHMSFCVGNAVKYLWRCGDKGNPIQDLEKARWYVDREIQRLANPAPAPGPQPERLFFIGDRVKVSPDGEPGVVVEGLDSDGDYAVYWDGDWGYVRANRLSPLAEF